MLGRKCSGKLTLGHIFCWDPKLRDGIKPRQWWPCLLKRKCIRKSDLPRKRSRNSRWDQERVRPMRFASFILGQLSEHNPTFLESLHFCSWFHTMCFYTSSKNICFVQASLSDFSLESKNLSSSIIYIQLSRGSASATLLS